MDAAQVKAAARVCCKAGACAVLTGLTHTSLQTQSVQGRLLCTKGSEGLILVCSPFLALWGRAGEG